MRGGLKDAWDSFAREADLEQSLWGLFPWTWAG